MNGVLHIDRAAFADYGPSAVIGSFYDGPVCVADGLSSEDPAASTVSAQRLSFAGSSVRVSAASGLLLVQDMDGTLVGGCLPRRACARSASAQRGLVARFRQTQVRRDRPPR